MHTRIEPLVGLATKVADLWSNIYLALDSGSLPMTPPVARLSGATLNEFDKRLRATLDFIPALAKLDDTSQLMFLPRVDAVIKQLKVANQHLTQLFAELAPQAGVSYKDPNGNLEQIQRVLNGSVTSNISSGGILDQVHAAIVALFDLVAGGVKFGRGQSFSLYLSHGEQLRTLLGAARPVADEIRKLRDKAVVTLQTLKERSEEVDKLAADVQAAQEKAQIDQGQITASLNEAQAKIAVIRETAQAAASLQTQVSSYAAEFAGFQKSLDTMLDQHAVFVKEMEDSRARNQEREAEIDRLTQKSESMIQGATTAGLGDSLEKTRKLYEDRMGGARLGFLFSVALLLICAMPLLAQLFPGLFVGWLPVAPAPAPATGGGADAFIALLGKLVLLFPATWVTSFFSKSYAECFHLEREYAHKAALARSVEGFKKQAPKYEEEITTAVFFEVQANPSKQAAPDPAEHPIMGPLMKKFIEALPLGKAEKTLPSAGK
jgi:hypothetical protein